jgi:hypothetical protein
MIVSLMSVPVPAMQKTKREREGLCVQKTTTATRLARP